VKPTTARPSATAVWENLHRCDPAESLLGELTRRGLFQTPPFVLLTWTGSL
jgi:hypothetical protein